MKNFIKNYFKKSIEKIAKENEKTFGNTSKLDCCGLNKPNDGNKGANTQNK
ncbi:MULTISPECIES: LDCC motif putative metal-binding protein [Clostridium]|uniref:Uncharacterized protein n=2 Tax=Clostridium TaxID=1485 RepID=A0A151ALD3_9CLOT|nr:MULTISPECIES: LDCC motif putative metal-binding protein [Clostridium]KYH28197.1 hypothetical protein CLCOL_21500 [Clostridium colicanis DSM 13634]PRR76604.1 hypothetical protein CPAL_02750 [Clostridium thermopalmarium DSM 5974]PVZ28283.1 hypothetical protein LX19_00254 [Clostridium thermopalmarium DSM 5974]